MLGVCMDLGFRASEVPSLPSSNPKLLRVSWDVRQLAQAFNAVTFFLSRSSMYGRALGFTYGLETGGECE